MYFTEKPRKPMTASEEEMLRKAQVVAGLFEDLSSARDAVNVLKATGFTEEQIGLAVRDRDERGERVEEPGTRASEEALRAAVGGSVVGALAGLLVGLGVVVIPGLGPLVAGGTLGAGLGVAGATVVAGAGIGAATGGLLGALIGLEIPEAEARYFEAGVRAGRVLVTVRAEDRAGDALRILQRYGADAGHARESRIQ